MGRLIALFLLVFSLNVRASDDVLDYLYTPELNTAWQNTFELSHELATTGQSAQALSISKELIDSITDDTPREIQGKLLINHGIILSANHEYDRAVRFINNGIDELSEFHVSRINGLMARAITEINMYDYESSIDSLRHAQHIIHRNEGVQSATQQPIASLLALCYVRLGDLDAADTQQRFRVYVAEHLHGVNSPEILPILMDVGNYFTLRALSMPSLDPFNSSEYLYQSAILAHERSVEVIENNYGTDSPRLVEPLTRLAEVRNLHDPGDRDARKMLERTLTVLEGDENTDPTDYAMALVQIGDYHTLNLRESDYYLKASRILAADFFATAVRIFPWNRPDILINRPKGVSGELYVVMLIDVLPNGKVDNIRVEETNVGPKNTNHAVENAMHGRYRPRIVNGVVVATHNIMIRQNFKAIE